MNFEKNVQIKIQIIVYTKRQPLLPERLSFMGKFCRLIVWESFSYSYYYVVL